MHTAFRFSVVYRLIAAAHAIHTHMHAGELMNVLIISHEMSKYLWGDGWVHN